jgi:hypothetical protein
MISPSLNKSEFIKAVQDKERQEIIRIATEEVMAVERLPLGRKPKVGDRPMEAQAWENRKWAIGEYNKFVRAFLFFMRNPVIRPAGIDDWDFQLFRPVCEKLVQKKQLSPQVLDLFK